MPLVSFPLEGTEGESVTVEVDAPPNARGLERCSTADGVFRIDQSFQRSLEGIRTIAKSAAAGLKDLEFDSGEIALGFKLTAGTGVVLAKAGAEAHIAVRLVWKRPPTK